jgi:predicted SAM-dependent methyltransferase
MTQRLLFSPDALLRFRNGRMLLHTTASRQPAFETDNPMLIGWLCQFAKPTAPAAALTQLPPESRADAAKLLDHLQRGGTLLEAQEAPPDPESTARARQHVRLLARSFYELACDLTAFGPHAETELAARTGIGVERRLMALLAASDSLRQQLMELRNGFLAPQLQRLQTSQPLRLHIGCGKGLLEGWINIDVHPAPLSMNVMWGLPVDDASVRFIFVSHLLEHLFFPRDVTPFLRELRRVLAPGGVVRLVVPDVEQCIEAYRKQDAAFFASRRETWSWWPENPTRLEDFLAYAGAGAEPAYAFESHKFGYDFETLRKVLEQAGFGTVVRSEYMQSAHADLRVDEVSAVAKARYGERYYSLFVEASPA